MADFPATRSVVRDLVALDRVGSTNVELSQRAAAGARPWTVVLTDNQTSGRGRRGRSWSLPPGSGLAISVLVPGTAHGGEGWYPLAAGAAMADAVRAALPRHSVGVKWPNDVLVGDRKICGILAELLPSGQVVVGAGLNDRMSDAQLPSPLATSLAIEGASIGGDEVVADFVVRMRRLIEDLQAANGDAEASKLRALVIDRCVTLGRTVRVELSGGDELRGRAEGIDP